MTYLTHVPDVYKAKTPVGQLSTRIRGWLPEHQTGPQLVKAILLPLGWSVVGIPA